MVPPLFPGEKLTYFLPALSVAGERSMQPSAIINDFGARPIFSQSGLKESCLYLLKVGGEFDAVVDGYVSLRLN